MKKIKLLHLTTSLKTGGAETLLVDLVRNLDPSSFENYVIYFYDGPNVEKLLRFGLKAYQIKGLICKYDPVFIFRLFWTIKKIKPDCIHSLLWSANILGTIIAKILSIPISCALHLATNFESNGKNSYFRTFLDKKILPKSDNMIVISDNMLKDLQRNNNWIPFEKINVIKNGIDINTINEQINSSQEKLKKNNDTFVVGNVGRFIPRKNQKILIEAFAMLSKEFENINLILIGYGETESLLKAKAKELAVYEKISFIRTNNPYEYYEIFDCFALTSESEGLPIVLLEAMVFGLPCIVTSNQPSHEVINNKFNGYVIRDNDILDLYSKLKILYLDKNERKRIGENAKTEVYANYNVTKMVKSYESVFKTLSSKQKVSI